MSFWVKSIGFVGIVAVVLAFYATAAFCDGPALFAGKWTLNQAQSDNPQKKFAQAFQQSGGPGGRSGHHHQSTSDDNKPQHRDDKMSDKIGSLFDAPGAITIETGDESVKVTDSKGNDLTYYTDGRKSEKVVGKGRTLTFRARWEEDALIVQSQGPDGGDLTESYYLSSDGKQLFVKLQLRPVFLDQPVTIIRVYDPAPTQTQTAP